MKTRAQRIKDLLTHLEVQENGVVSALTAADEETLTVLEATSKEDGLSDSSKGWFKRLLRPFMKVEEGMSDKDLRNAIDTLPSNPKP